MRRLHYIAAIVLLVCLAQMAHACPTCKDSLASGPNSANLVRGFGWSIMFMMSAPFVILASLAGYFYYEVRKARKLQLVGATVRAETQPS